MTVHTLLVAYFVPVEVLLRPPSLIPCREVLLSFREKVKKVFSLEPVKVFSRLLNLAIKSLVDDLTSPRLLTNQWFCFSFSFRFHRYACIAWNLYNSSM